MHRESILNVFPTDDDSGRLVIAVEQSDSGRSRLVLRQESRSDHVGWFVQSRIVIEPEQVTGLKMVLSSRSARPLSAPQGLPAPAILSFAAATAAAS